MLWGDAIGLRAFEDPATDAEIERVYRWSRDERILRWSGGSPTELTLQEFCERLRGEQRNPSDHRRAFFIVTRPLNLQASELIGRIGCFGIDWDKREGELGIVIGEPARWGRGYGRAAVALLLRHLFQATVLERVNLFTYAENLRAQRCFAACGFRAISTARRFSPDIGAYDGVEMEITRREFLGQHGAPSVLYTDEIKIYEEAK
jgi:RimJ/RimL family protein N-acetyltransferase